MNKKIIAGVISLTMMSAVVMSAAASETMTVTYKKETSYVMSIPSRVELSDINTVGVTNIGVSEVNTEPNKVVVISLKEGIEYVIFKDESISPKYGVLLERENDTDTKIYASATLNGSTAWNSGPVAEFTGTSTVPIDSNRDGRMSFGGVESIDGGVVKAGKYTTTLVFEGSVKDLN